MRIIFILSLVVLTTSTCEAAQRCYGDLGCFETVPGFDGLPQSPDQIRTDYVLFTRSTRNQPTRVVARQTNAWHHLLGQGHFSKFKDTKFIIHGFLDKGNKDWVLEMKNELLKKGDFNVFVVDWGHGSVFPYTQATANCFVVSAELAKFLKYLRTNEGLDLANVHLIGHSLGAHTAGNAGAVARGIGRITGLDPAEPHFISWGSNKRLDKTDAIFVDVIHTDGEPFLGVKGYGLITPMGHVDFYPNGGVDQPGCADTIGGMLIGIIDHGNGKSISCSHSRSHSLFIESINSRCVFRSHTCTDWASYEAGNCHGCRGGGCPPMGYDSVASSARGSFYLSTTQQKPFCGHEYFVEVDLSAKQQLTTGRIYVTLTGSTGHSHTVEFTRDFREYHARDTEKHVIAVHQSVGHVSSVKVMFKRKFGFTSGTANDVVVHRVYVQDLYTSHRIKFCGHDADVNNNAVVTLTSHSGC